MKIKDIILNACQYTGNTEKHQRVIGCSSLKEDALKLGMKFYYGAIPQTTIEANTLGSVFDLSIRQIFKNQEGFFPMKRLNYKLANGWTLSGETDLTNYDQTTNTLTIFDIKLTKEFTLKKVIKEGAKSAYGVQLKAYKFLVKNHIIKLGKPMPNFKLILLIFIKDGGHIKNWKKGTTEYKPTLNEVEIIDDNEDIEALALAQTNKVEAMLQNPSLRIPCQSWKCPYCEYTNICKYKQTSN